jgi:hypothetical protein
MKQFLIILRKRIMVNVMENKTEEREVMPTMMIKSD